jgi:hypothetical protein
MRTDRLDEANSRFPQFCEINRFCTTQLLANCSPVSPLTLNGFQWNTSFNRYFEFCLLSVMKAYLAETCRRKNKYIVDEILFVYCWSLFGDNFSYISDICFNLLKPTGHVMHQKFEHSTTVRSAHNVFMCFVFF